MSLKGSEASSRTPIIITISESGRLDGEGASMGDAAKT
jgi:hypothetical protein